MVGLEVLPKELLVPHHVRIASGWTSLILRSYCHTVGYISTAETNIFIFVMIQILCEVSEGRLRSAQPPLHWPSFWPRFWQLVWKLKPTNLFLNAALTISLRWLFSCGSLYILALGRPVKNQVQCFLCFHSAAQLYASNMSFMLLFFSKITN